MWSVRVKCKLPPVSAHTRHPPITPTSVSTSTATLVISKTGPIESPYPSFSAMPLHRQEAHVGASQQNLRDRVLAIRLRACAASHLADTSAVRRVNKSWSAQSSHATAASKLIHARAACPPCCDSLPSYVHCVIVLTTSSDARMYGPMFCIIASAARVTKIAHRIWVGEPALNRTMKPVNMTWGRDHGMCQRGQRNRNVLAGTTPHLPQ